MDDTNDCRDVRPLLPELAAGAAAGDDRSRALDHVAGCAVCREELAELTKTADAVLLLAPSTEPPVGFESRVLARLGGRDGTRIRRRRATLALAAALLTAVLSGAIFEQWRSVDDRRLADQYRETLAVANGRYFKAAPITSADAQPAGTVFLYQGNPSWVLITITAAPADGPYGVLVIDTSGGAHLIGTCQVTGHTVTAGYQLPLPVAQIRQVRLHAADPAGAKLSANL